MAKKVLIVDDDEHILKLLTARLKSNGYDTVVASDGLYAVMKAHEEKPDLIILDVRMPAGGGMTVFENLKMSSETMSTPVIFITGYPDDEVRSKVIAMGAREFISKPFDANELLEKVKTVLKENDAA